MSAPSSRNRAHKPLTADDLDVIEQMRAQALQESGYHYMSHVARHLIETEIEHLVRCLRRCRCQPMRPAEHD